MKFNVEGISKYRDAKLKKKLTRIVPMYMFLIRNNHYIVTVMLRSKDLYDAQDTKILFISTIPLAKKCTSNFFGVSLQCCWLLVGSDLTDFKIMTTRSPHPWIIVKWPHSIVNFNESITCIVNINVLYYISSHSQY